MRRIAVIGLGNLFMGDDGVGLRAVEELRKAGLAPGVDLLDVGTPGLGLTPYIHGYDVVIFVDAAQAAEPAGAVRVYTRKELLALPAQPRLSPHDPAVKEALLLAELEGSGPEDALLVGVVPENCCPGLGLTPAVEAAVPEIVRAVSALVRTIMGRDEDRHLERELDP